MRTILLLLTGFSTTVSASPSLLHLFTIDTMPPVVTCPADRIVSCEQFDPALSVYGQPIVSGIPCIDTVLSLANYAQFDSLCNRGTIKRIFLAFDCDGNLSTCSQRVVVNYTQNYFIKFPDDTLVTACNSTGVYGRPTFFGEDCELMGVSYEDEIFGLIWPDACFRIDRIWTVINWCAYNPGQPLTNVPNPALVLTTYHHPLNAPGPLVSACGTAAPWAPTISKIYPTDTVETNFCSFWNANSNGYRYTQLIKIADTIPPIIANCPIGPLLFIDSTANDTSYWNHVYNPFLPAQNLGEREVNLSLEATDACSGPQIWIKFFLFLDLDGDGVQESVVNSDNPPPAGKVLYNNVQAPNYNGGTPTAFDTRPVPQNQKWRFAAQQPFGDSSRTAALRWNTEQSPNTYVVPELPVGTHKIKWIVQDACGVESTCEYTFTIQASTFECIPPANVVVSCEQFDPSLLAFGGPVFGGSCLIDTVLKSANYAQFDSLCSRGTIVRHFNAVDNCGNTSHCTQQIVVYYAQDYYIKFPNDVIITDCDGLGNYGEPSFFGEDCELLTVSYEDVFPEPGVPDACFKFERIWTIINGCHYNPNVLLTNVPNPNPSPMTNHPANLHGPTVSACGTPIPWASSLVKINPTDPSYTDYCTFWSANANGYMYKQLIKIIDNTAPIFNNCPAPPLHYADSTLNNPMFWNHVFNPNLPAQDLRETEANLSVMVSDACSGSNINIEYLLFLDLDADGQQETVVNSVNTGLGGLGWNNVRYNNINTPNLTGGTPTAFDDRPVPTDQKWGFAIQESIQGNNRTASVRWNTQQSPNSFVLPELPNGRHKIKWFATDGCGNNKECEYIFSIGDTTLVGTYTPENDDFTLCQNEPNPFGSSTSIRFQLPESSTAMLSVFDANGKLLFQQTADYSQGMHTLTLEKDQLASSGVLFYKLEAGKNMAWRKMVLFK